MSSSYWYFFILDQDLSFRSDSCHHVVDLFIQIGAKVFSFFFSVYNSDQHIRFTFEYKGITGSIEIQRFVGDMINAGSMSFKVHRIKFVHLDFFTGIQFDDNRITIITSGGVERQVQREDQGKRERKTPSPCLRRALARGQHKKVLFLSF